VGVRDRLAQLLAEAPPEAQAIEFEESWRTWRFFQSITRSLDEVLAANRLGPGARIGLVLENRPEHVGVVAGLLASGRCLVTLSPLQPPERLAMDIERSESPLVIASPEVLARPGVREAIERAGIAVELGADGSMRTLGGAVTSGSISNEGVAVEMMTSGTTGPPKRIHIRELQLDSSLRSSAPEPKPGVLLRTGVTLVVTPLVHIGGLWGAISALYAGRRIVLLRKFALEPWLRAVETHRPRACGLVPAALRTVLGANVPREKLSSLQVVTSGTTYCPPELADEFFRRYGIRVLMTYGATEFAGAVAAWTLPMHEQWWEKKKGSAGRAVPGTELRITDPDGKVLGPGETGHLEIRSAQSPQGPDAWVRTSDLASLDEDGFLWIKGRADDAIIRGGFKVHPEHVRSVLERHPSVREAAVAPLPDPRLGQVPVAAVELVPGAPVPTMSELIAFCREVLTPYEAPVHIAIADELPRTPSSKVSRVELLDLIRASMSATGSGAE